MKNTKCLLYFTHKIKPTRLELKYVHETYDLIAEHFNHTRYAKWPKVKQFIDTI